MIARLYSDNNGNTGGTLTIDQLEYTTTTNARFTVNLDGRADLRR